MILSFIVGGMVVVGQTAAAGSPSPAALDVNIPQVQGLEADPTCGGRAALVSVAFCMSTTQAAAEGVVTQLSAAFAQQGWLAADGRENLVVYVKRKPDGGCDSFQMVAFAEDSRPAAPAAPAYLALATIPVDICKAQAPAAQ